MDNELLIALLILWSASTVALIIFLRMWFSNDGAAFHPHSVDVDNRHPAYLVVNSRTVCKKDCAIKSISAFVAPRGSSSSKHFTVLSVILAIGGILGSTRWYFVGDASKVQFILAAVGFGSLLLVAAFELDVEPERFLEDKQMITGWLIQKLKLEKELPFRLGPKTPEFREFIRNSPEIYHLFEEDRYLKTRHTNKNMNIFSYEVDWQSAHIVGAVTYVTLVPAAIILNDIAEQKVAWITGLTFVLFCAMGYLTGNYVPVIRRLRCYVLTWNPFLREPFFMVKLKHSVEAYARKQNKLAVATDIAEKKIIVSNSGGVVRNRSNTGTNRKKHGSSDFKSIALKEGIAGFRDSPPSSRDSKTSSPVRIKSSMAILPTNSDTKTLLTRVLIDKMEAAEADKCLDNSWLRYARTNPVEYLRLVSYINVMTELISLMTPCVAMGIQWVTALCDGPPVLAIIELLVEFFMCIRTGGAHCQFNAEHFTHCILKPS